MTALITRAGRGTREAMTRNQGWPFDHMLESFMNLPTKHGHCESYNPSVDIIESDDDIKMTFLVPGMSKDDINIKVEDDILTVSGKRESRVDAEKANYVHREISYGEFTRSFNLSDSIDTGRIEANYDNGLLEIVLTKKEEVKPKQIEVKIS